MNIVMSGCDLPSVGKFMKERLEEQGHKVFGFGLKGPDFVIDITKELNPNFLEHLGGSIFSAAYAYFGEQPVDCVFNHAGVTELDWIEEHDLATFQDLWRINCFLPFIMSRELVRQVRDEENASYTYWVQRRIINTCTIGTSISLRSSSGYISSKGALESLTKNMSKELAGRWPIIVIGVAPGGILDTPMTETEKRGHMRTRNWTREQAEAYALTSNLGRKCTWEELWAIYDFAINSAPEYMTGSIIKVPNGLGVS